MDLKTISSPLTCPISEISRLLGAVAFSVKVLPSKRPSRTSTPSTVPVTVSPVP